MQEPTVTCDFDVVILGAGWSGLLACKYCLSEGLRTLVLDKRETVGGVWAYTDDPRFGGVMKTTQTTSSRCITEISDFPMPADYPDFPSHPQILDYLRGYCLRFDLDRHILLGREVAQVEKTKAVWKISCSNGEFYRCKSLIVSTGVHQCPNDVSADPRFRGFGGPVLHSAAVKEVSDHYVKKTIVVWGGGESASDVAFETSKVARRVYFCIPNGQWFVPKVVDRWPPFPSDRRKIVDHTSSRLRLFLSPTHRFSPFINQYLQYAFGFNGHGQDPWSTDAPYNRSFFNKSSEVLSRVKSGHVVAKRDIHSCDGSYVTFTDGESVSTDVIITCSGYKAAFPFFTGSAPSADPRRWYKYLFYNEDPSIALVGFVRPIFGSIPGIAEIQSRYVAKVFAERLRLPNFAERKHLIEKDARFWNHHFRYTSLRLNGLVDHFLYCDEIAKLIGCRPRFWTLFWRSPKKWWKAITAPWNGSQYWLCDESQHDRIFETFARYAENRISEVYTFLLLAPLLPFLGLATQTKVLWRERVLGRDPTKVQRPHA